MQSEQVNEIAAALAKAQGAISNPALDGINPHFKSKYSTLAAICNAGKAALSENGIACVQKGIDCENGVKIETIFYHSSGQWLSAGVVSVPADKFNAHGLGSALTYARRYALSMALGVAGEADDDGNSAVANPPKRPVSVAQTALEGVVVDWGMVAKYVAPIQSAVMNEDDSTLQELMAELADDNDLKIAVWTKLNSRERSYIKKAAA